MPEDRGQAQGGEAGAVAKRQSLLAQAVSEIESGKDQSIARNLRPDLVAYGGTSDVHLVWGDEKRESIISVIKGVRVS